ncbi:UvrD-helicase domain-containing protein [Moraxella sp. ZY210820]|uniref:UvrD-helicase domain-containing protein n=1 Tax=unclassified Moraxella TaxID=2685852 RepID=UPI0027301F53|nr:UvrD-helicase domain-containing protein [Moraxella sp. ZY210820]WLF84188.1 AAA family ATPase [Moraxella sp. ZY210820]
MSNLSPTDEQLSAINQAQQGQSFKVIAYAGTGKTTTLQMVSQALQHKRGMYLAFNKSIADEAQQKFHQNVNCRTFHSLAFRSVPRNITDKLRLPRLSPSFLAQEYRLEPITLRRLMGGRYEKYTFMPSRLANVVSNGVSYFCSTASQYPGPRHLQAPDWLHQDDIEHLQQHLYPALERRWLDSINPQHQAGIGHDIYLKLWALSEPNIPCDYILFDEAQDADPLMLGILLKQKNTQVIYVGDAHQQIYAWRGAVNAMQKLPLAESRLTTSFRFGEPIAEVANHFLSALDEKVPLLGNPNHQSKVITSPHHKARDAILCRTNARAMELLLSGLITGDKVALQADIQRLNRFVEASSQLKQGKRSVDVPELAWFNSWHDVHEYCETNEGSDLKTLVKLVDEHGTDPLKKALAKITPTEQADYIISTAHKAKGLEWKRVHLEDDYQFKLNAHDYKISDEELRLLYVACTRAKDSLNIQHIRDLLDKIKSQQRAK